MTTPCNARLLLIETSGAVGHVGLAASGTLLSEAVLDRGRQHTRDLIPQCQRLCEQAGWKPTDLDAIVVSAGPGSYTGLRVGIMTAKTLAYALNKPLVSVPTFEIIAQQNFTADLSLHALTVIADGQQDKVYVQNFERADHQGIKSGDQPVPLSPPGRGARGEGFLCGEAQHSLTILPGEPWRASLPAATTLTGPGLRQQQPHLPPCIRVLPDHLWDPQLPSLLQLGLQHLESNHHADPFALEPLYLRASSAEEQWAAMGK